MLMVFRKKRLSACLGNAFEHYDTALFSFLSPFLAPLIFPNKNPLTALILTYAIIPLGMLARPLGALIFGYIGDRHGREHALCLTLSCMAGISGAIAFIPTYAQAGIASPILICLGRALQNFFSAGEVMGGAIYVLEHTPEKRQDLMSSLYSASAIGGHLLAALGVYIITRYCIDPGWRVLYLFGCITAVFGSLLRGPSSFQPTTPLIGPIQSIKRLLCGGRIALLKIIVTAGFAHATYSMALVLMNGLIPLVTPLPKSLIMQTNIYFLLFDFCAFPFFGYLSSKISRKKLMLSVCFSVVICATSLLTGLKNGSMERIIAIRALLVIFGVAFFAPFHAFAQQLVEKKERYAVISFGYAIGSQLLGSPTAMISLWCFQKTKTLASVAWYWMLLGLLSGTCILMEKKAKTAKQLS